MTGRLHFSIKQKSFCEATTLLSIKKKKPAWVGRLQPEVVLPNNDLTQFKKKKNQRTIFYNFLVKEILKYKKASKILTGAVTFKVLYAFEEDY